MLWCDQLVEKLDSPQVINDSKTPSGRAHVGALRGPLIHDAIFRTLKSRQVPVKYIFGCDDFDPVDEIPYGEREHFEQYLGAPLCNTPPPPGSAATEMADHYITEFWKVFAELGVQPEFYRMRDVYRSGRFNEAIDAILRRASDVRRIYKEVSGAEKPETWHPFQVICEKCGRVGTTEVSAFDGREVTYECRPDLVKWARGCGHRGKISPFDGRGKLPWKLEWCAKWRTFPVTIEGAGQDHSTKGGSRDVAIACLRTIFGQEPPLNCPYDFFLVGGAKMSSSRGVGVTSRDMADFLPAEVLRFLMIRTPPRQHVNFEPTEVHIIKTFNEFDRFRHRYFNDPKINAADRRIYELSQVAPEPNYWAADFQLIAALIQMPHLDVWRELETRKGGAFTELERRHLESRLKAARYWLERYATEEEKTRLQDTLPARAAELTAAQRGFLHGLAVALPGTPWTDDSLQGCIFNVARLTPIEQPMAFKAIYRVLLDRDAGPKAGNLLSFLDRDFVTRRFAEPPFDRLAFWHDTALAGGDIEVWLKREQANIASHTTRFEWEPAGGAPDLGVGVVHVQLTLRDGKQHGRRLRVAGAAGEALAPQLRGEFITAARASVADVALRSGVALDVPAA